MSKQTKTDQTKPPRGRWNEHTFSTSGDADRSEALDKNSVAVFNSGRTVALNLRPGHQITASVQNMSGEYRYYGDTPLCDKEDKAVVLFVENKDGKETIEAVSYNEGGRDMYDRVRHVATQLARRDITLVQTDNADDITKASLHDIMDEPTTQKVHKAYVKQDVPHNYRLELEVVEYETKPFPTEEKPKSIFDSTTETEDPPF